MNPPVTALPLSSPLDVLDERLDALLPGADVAPRTLHRAMRHAVFPGGKRIRPRLLLTVSAACAAGEAEAELSLSAACAIELIHSASLVHDDLPCFDDASLRRGRPTVHALFGEPMAILAGDALLTRAFELMAETPPRLARRALRIVRLLGQATGSLEGIIGGQSLEESLHAPELIERYHAMKTAALFRLAAEAGATAAGAADTSAWAEVGHNLGLGYQLADDLCDIHGSTEVSGKPVRRDALLGRPNAALQEGERAARARLQALLERVRSQAIALAADPHPLTALLDDMTCHFQKSTAG